MKKTYALSVLSFFVTLSFAQITIGQGDMPNANDTIRVSMTGSIAPNNVDSTGANYNWDYSMLVPAMQNVEKFKSPLNTAYPFPFSVTASYGQYVYTPDSIPFLGNVTPTDVWNFFKKSSSQYKQVGIGETVMSLPVPITFSSADVVYRFPMQYGNQDSSVASYSFSIPNLFTYGQTIKRWNVVDGWGTLKTPFGIFNTLRVKSTLAVTDTMYLDTLGFGFSIPRPLAYEYKWLATAKKIPVLQVDATNVFGNPVVNNVIYQDSIRPVAQLGISEVMNAADVSLFPNPASSSVLLQYKLALAADISFDIYTLTGQRIRSFRNGRQGSGTHVQFVDVSGLSLGIYFFRLGAGDRFITKKLVVNR